MKTIRSAFLALAAVSLLVLTGCTVGQSVPRTKVNINPATHQVALDNPKDTTIKNFRARFATNGECEVSWDTLSTVMNPDVITTTGDAQAKMIAATGAAVTQALQAAGGAAGAAAGAFAK